MNQPDPKNHQRISFAKSFIRVVAGAALMSGMLYWAGALIIAAEVLGVLEEMV